MEQIFIINKNYTDKNIKAISTSVTYINIQLNARYPLKLIQAYAPTSTKK